MHEHDSPQTRELLHAARAAVVTLLEQRDYHNVSEKMSEALRHMVLARNRLIGARRTGNLSAEGSAVLDRLNAVISVATGITYPTSGTRWSTVEEVRDALAEMVALE